MSDWLPLQRDDKQGLAAATCENAPLSVTELRDPAAELTGQLVLNNGFLLHCGAEIIGVLTIPHILKFSVD